jgi:hypothetical protein
MGYALACFNRGLTYFEKGDCKKGWEDVKRVEELGWRVPPEILERLRETYGREM